MKIGSGIKKALKKGTDVTKKAFDGDKKSGDSKGLKGILGDKLSEKVGDKLGDKLDGKKLDKAELSEELFGKDVDELSKEEKKKLKEIEKMLKGEKEEKEAPAAEAGGAEAPAAPAPPAAPAAPAAPAGNSALDQQLSQLAMSVLREGMSGAGGGSRQQLEATYQQAGGQGNMSISRQTHDLVALALGGGGASGLSLAGLGGGQHFPQQMGINPNFGGMMAA